MVILGGKIDRGDFRQGLLRLLRRERFRDADGLRCLERWSPRMLPCRLPNTAVQAAPNRRPRNNAKLAFASAPPRLSARSMGARSQCPYCTWGGAHQRKDSGAYTKVAICGSVARVMGLLPIRSGQAAQERCSAAEQGGSDLRTRLRSLRPARGRSPNCTSVHPQKGRARSQYDQERPAPADCSADRPHRADAGTRPRLSRTDVRSRASNVPAECRS